MKDSVFIKKDSILIITAIILVGLNLRPSMAAIGPLLNLIRYNYSTMKFSTVALLTVLPVICNGSCNVYWK